MNVDKNIQPQDKKEIDNVTLFDKLDKLIKNVEMLTYAIKEDMQFRIPSKFNGLIVENGLPNTTDQVITLSEPISSFTLSVPVWGNTTIVYVALETHSAGAFRFRLTPSLPSKTFGDLQVKNIHYSSDAEGAIFEVIGVRGL